MRSRTAADMEGGSLVSMTTDPCTLPLTGTSSQGSGPVDPRSWRFGFGPLYRWSSYAGPANGGAANQVS